MIKQKWPQYWTPDCLVEAVVSGSTAGVVSLGPGNADAAVYVPVVFPASATLTAIRFAAMNTTGDYDLGFYTRDFVRIASTGTTAMSAAVQSLNVGLYRVSAGETYWAALAMSNTGGRFIGRSTGSINQLKTAGCGEEASAEPLPATATPVIPSSWLHIPIFTFMRL